MCELCTFSQIRSHICEQVLKKSCVGYVKFTKAMLNIRSYNINRINHGLLHRKHMGGDDGPQVEGDTRK